MEDLLYFVGFIILCVLAATGFSVILKEERILPEYYLQAEMVCETSQGVDYLEMDNVTLDVYCNNGSLFKRAVKR